YSFTLFKLGRAARRRLCSDHNHKVSGVSNRSSARSIPSLEVDMHHQLAQPDFVTVAQQARLVGRKALPVQECAVGAVEVDDREHAIAAPEGGVDARDTALQRIEWCEVQVGLDTAG